MQVAVRIKISAVRVDRHTNTTARSEGRVCWDVERVAWHEIHFDIHLFIPYQLSAAFRGKGNLGGVRAI